MGRKNKNGPPPKDNPRAIYTCINKDCLKKWIFVGPEAEDECDDVCQACSHPVQKETGKEKDKPQSAKPTEEEIMQKKEAKPSKQKSGSRKPRKDGDTTVHSKKYFTVYKCTKEECGATWQSVHGWTEGFPQRCRKTKNTSGFQIPCGNPGAPIRIREIPMEVKDGEKKGKSIPHWRWKGRHNADFCDMCAKLKGHGKGICTDKTDVFIKDRGATSESVDYINGPPPSSYPYIIVDRQD